MARIKALPTALGVRFGLMPDSIERRCGRRKDSHRLGKRMLLTRAPSAYELQRCAGCTSHVGMLTLQSSFARLVRQSQTKP